MGRGMTAAVARPWPQNGPGRHVCMGTSRHGPAMAIRAAMAQAFGAGEMVVYLAGAGWRARLDGLAPGGRSVATIHSRGQLVVLDAVSALRADRDRRHLLARAGRHAATATRLGLGATRIVVDLGTAYPTAPVSAILDWESGLDGLAARPGVAVTCVFDSQHADPRTQAIVEATHDDRRTVDTHPGPLACILSTGYPGGLEVVGDLDVSNADLLERAVRSASRGTHGVELDLGEVGFMDLAATRALVAAAGRLDDGSRLLIRRAPPSLHRLLELGGWEAPRLHLDG